MPDAKWKGAVDLLEVGPEGPQQASGCREPPGAEQRDGGGRTVLPQDLLPSPW